MKGIKFLTNHIYTVEKFSGSVLNFIGTILIVRYLGPSQYAVLGESSSVVSLFVGFAMLGIDRITIMDATKLDYPLDVIITNTIFLRFLGSFLCILFSLSYSIYLGSGNLFLFVMISSINVFFQSFFVIEFVLLGSNNGKRFFRFRLLVSLLELAVKILFILLEFNLVWFLILPLTSTILLISYISYSFKGGVINLPLNMAYIKDLLSRGWPLILSLNLSIFAERFGNSYVIGKFASAEYGNYFLAYSISEVFILLFYFISNGALRELYLLKDNSVNLFNKKVVTYFEFFVLISVLMFIGYFFFGKLVVARILGENYLGSFYLFKFFILLIFLRVLVMFKVIYYTMYNVNKWTIIENALSLILIVFILNYSINSYGIKGLIFSNIVVSATALFVLSVMNSKGRDFIGLFLRTFQFVNVRKKVINVKV